MPAVKIKTDTPLTDDLPTWAVITDKPPSARRRGADFPDDLLRLFRRLYDTEQWAQLDLTVFPGLDQAGRIGYLRRAATSIGYGLSVRPRSDDDTIVYVAVRDKRRYRGTRVG